MTGRRLLTAGAVALAIGAALPSMAAATDYCVAPNTSCGANNVDDLQIALTKAQDNSGADRVLLSEGTYVAGANGFKYASFDPVEIVGAGEGRTILTSPAQSDGQVLWLLSGMDSSIHDLTIRIPQRVQAGFTGLYTSTFARRIQIVENEDQVQERRGARIAAPGVLEDSTVTLGAANTSVGVWLTGASVNTHPNVVRGSTITADRGVFADSGGRIERSSVTGAHVAVDTLNGVTEVADSVLRCTTEPGAAVYAGSLTPQATVRVDSSTIDSGCGTGIYATSKFIPTVNINVEVGNSVIRAAKPLYAEAPGAGNVTLAASYSDYDPTGNVHDGVHASIEEANVQNAGDARFVDAAGGDYRLLPGSPLVDAGDPGAAQGLDLGGNPLVADGNGDGAARRDIGAFELQPPAQPQADTQPPVITGFRARRTGVSYGVSENARVTVKVQRRLAGKRIRYRTVGKLSANAVQGANRTRAGTRLRRKEARPGRYRAVIVAVDAAGNRSAPMTAGFRIRPR